MKITRLKVENFKSFDTLDVELGDFNVFIGANASGKSNFLSILAFLRDIARDGLEDAVSMQGGDISLLRNVQLGHERETTIRADWGNGLDDPGHPPRSGWEGALGQKKVRFSGFRYEIDLQHEPDDFYISRENTTWAGYFEEQSKTSGKSSFDTISDDRKSPLKEDTTPSNGSLLDRKEGPRTSLLHFEPRGHLLLSTRVREELTDVRVYDFATTRTTGVSSQKGRSHLEEDGSNVALVLRTLLRDDEKRRTFLNLARALLPFVDDLGVDRFAGESLLVKLQESYAEDTYLPASLLSDGTIKVVALLIALYFEDRPIIAFEEPASNLHPKLISQLMQMMREASEKKQIFITTHNPEVIRHVDLENLYLVSRDDDGFSQITKPNDSEIVRHFLKNDLGIDDLFADDLLSL